MIGFLVQPKHLPAKWAASLLLVATALPVMADWRDEIGFTRLQLLVGTGLPTMSSQGVSQTEAFPVNTTDYAPDTLSTAFSGKSFSLKSGTSGTSPHADTVARNFYGNTNSLITGTFPVDLYNADSWLFNGFLRMGTNNAALTESRAVQNHSWIASTYSSAASAGQRLDFAINRDGFVCVVGENNGNSTVLPDLLGQGYHTISVGLVNGSHSAGFTTVETTGRIKPDIVAPDGATSFATPMVASAAALLFSKLAAAPYSLIGADRPRVIKALLLASATKDTVSSWANTSSRPLDLRYGAGELNINHAYNDLIAGRGIASISSLQNYRGWSAESVSGNSTKSYFFTIPSGNTPAPFSAAMTWHRALSGSFFSMTSSLADLNLRLYHATGFTKGAVVSESLSPVDNVELIHQTSLSPGTYVLEIANTSPSPTAYALAWHSLPAVSIMAASPTAREIDLHQGSFTVTRSGDTTLPLFVPLTLSGDAVAGTHFQSLSSSIIIAQGQSSATLNVVPIADSIAQGPRALTAAVAADFALVRDPLHSATVTIEDKPFDQWRFSHFNPSELADQAVSGPNADSDNDGIPNLVEYATASDPKIASPSPTLADLTTGYLSISVNKNTAATDIIWSADVSPDVENWSDAMILQNSASLFEARDNILVNAANTRLIRLRITRQ